MTAPMFELETGGFDFLDFVQSLELEAMDAMFFTLDAIGQETVDYLRSYTSETRPPAFPGGPPRPAHPGGWADITHELERSYKYTVDRRRTRNPTLKLENTSGHAVFLEERAGFFVLSGVMDHGGIVERAMRRAVYRFMPGAYIVEG